MKNNKNIEIGALRIFAAVTEADTLTQAAERLGVTQSAVSQTIKQLETQTETQLVVTRSRPIKLTPSGQVLKDYAQQIINDTQRMLADVRMTAKGGLLPLNVGMVDSFCDVAGLQLMQQVKPFVSKLALRTGLGSSLSQDLLNRNLDLLITSDPIDEHPELQRHPILRDRSRPRGLAGFGFCSAGLPKTRPPCCQMVNWFGSRDKPATASAPS